MSSLPNFPTDRFVKFIVILLLVMYGLVTLKMIDTVEFYTSIKKDLYTSMTENSNEIDLDYFKAKVDKLNKDRWIAIAILFVTGAVIVYFFIDQLGEWRKQDKKVSEAQDLDIKLKQAELDIRKLEIKKLEQEFASKQVEE